MARPRRASPACSCRFHVRKYSRSWGILDCRGHIEQIPNRIDLNSSYSKNILIVIIACQSQKILTLIHWNNAWIATGHWYSCQSMVVPISLEEILIRLIVRYHFNIHGYANNFKGKINWFNWSSPSPEPVLYQSIMKQQDKSILPHLRGLQCGAETQMQGISRSKSNASGRGYWDIDEAKYLIIIK